MAVYITNHLPTPTLPFKPPVKCCIIPSPITLTFVFSNVSVILTCRHIVTTSTMIGLNLMFSLLITTPNIKGVRCLHIPTGWIYRSRSVVFDELILPYAKQTFLPTPLPITVSSAGLQLLPLPTPAIAHACSTFPPISDVTSPVFPSKPLSSANSPSSPNLSESPSNSVSFKQASPSPSPAPQTPAGLLLLLLLMA